METEDSFIKICPLTCDDQISGTRGKRKTVTRSMEDLHRIDRREKWREWQEQIWNIRSHRGWDCWPLEGDGERTSPSSPPSPCWSTLYFHLFFLRLSPYLSHHLILLYHLNPLSSTEGRGGRKLDIEWNDDGQSPKLSSDWGSINIFLATGSHDVQFKLQELAQGLSNKKTDGSYRIDKTVGPNSDE